MNTNLRCATPGYHVSGKGQASRGYSAQGTSHSYTQGVATRDDIDKTLKLGMNHPMGPLQLGPSVHFRRGKYS